MFIFDKIEGNDSSFLEFEITGSTYEPIGDVFLKGQKVKGADYETLHELGTICIMCNDSAIDFNEFKQAFEKVNTSSTTLNLIYHGTNTEVLISFKNYLLLNLI